MASQSVRVSGGVLAMPLILEWGLILVGIALLTITEEYNLGVTIGILFILVSFCIGFLRGKNRFHTGIELSLMIFLASAGVATWISHERSIALLQFDRILASVVLFYSVVGLISEGGKSNYPVFQDHLNVLVFGLLLATTGLAIYWPLQHDFHANPVKIEIISKAGIWLTEHFPEIPGPSIHSNVAAGTLALALPFSVLTTYQARVVFQLSRLKRLILVSGCSLHLLLILSSLVLTSSRGAWLGLVGGSGLVLLIWIQRRWFANSRTMIPYWMAVGSLLLLVVAVILFFDKLDLLVGQIPDPSGSLQNRSSLWAQGIPLISDYVFTGSGLMSFRLVYALYGILIDTPFHDHLHNTYLEIWLEQGIFGLLAVAWMAAVIAGWGWKALWRCQANRFGEPNPKLSSSLWGIAGFLALVVVGIHGIVDVVFYVTRTLPLIGLIVGYAYNLVNMGEVSKDEPLNQSKTPGAKANRIGLIVVLGLGLSLIIGIVSYRLLFATWNANLGVIAQTRIELTLYDPKRYDDPTLDQVRQIADLSVAERRFQEALKWQPENQTALHRLTMIALSRGQYDRALTLAQNAWEVKTNQGFDFTPDDIPRLLLSDALVADGKPDAAADLVYGLHWAVNRLMSQAWYRYWVNEDYSRAASAWQTVLYLKPGQVDAVYWQRQAQQQMMEDTK
jgi:hypothetical protein